MSIFRVIFIALLMASCTSPENYREGFDWILHANPESEAISAADNGDLRLIGLTGMLLNEVPLIDKSCEYGSNVRYLKIDDVIDSFAEIKYQVIAPVYAEAYNYHLITYLRKKGIDICSS
ncbi:hypothetical protein ACJJIR_05435 [Microbulbifer sp. SSSA008]|uniref:hypothetical protein n=1 Tax=Microbulbifer sp. SSSA008 TaxID=3243380 RepID=UPI0040392C24